MDPRGKAFLNGDDPFLKQLGKEFPGRTFYYGFSAEVALRVLSFCTDQAGAEFSVLLHDGSTEDFRISLPGRHYVYNALAAIAVGLDFSLTNREI